MPLFVDVEPRFDDDAAKRVAVEVRDAVAQGVRDALSELIAGLSLTPDERVALEEYRNSKAVNTQRARAHIARLEGN